MRNWTAQHVFDFRFLKTLYQQLPQAQRSQGCQLIATNSGFANLGEVFNGSHTRSPEPWHIGWYVFGESESKLMILKSPTMCDIRHTSLHVAIYYYIAISSFYCSYGGGGGIEAGFSMCHVKLLRHVTDDVPRALISFTSIIYWIAILSFL
jgi:hypothetical protein